MKRKKKERKKERKKNRKKERKNKRYKIWTASKGGWVTDSSVVENYIRTELLLLFMKGSKWKKAKKKETKIERNKKKQKKTFLFE